MKRFIRWILIGSLASAGLASAQSLTLIEGAYELHLKDMIFPGGSTGSLIIRRCDTCDTESLRITLTTTYSTSKGRVPLTEFQQQVKDVRAETGFDTVIPVTVFYSLDSGDVTRVALHDGATP